MESNYNPFLSTHLSIVNINTPIPPTNELHLRYTIVNQ